MNNLNNIVDYLKVFNNINKRKAYEPRTMAQAPLANELEPGALKDEMLKDFDPSQETHEEYLQRKSLERPFNMAHGGMIGKPGGLVEEGVTMYGVVPRPSGRYVAEGARKGNRYKETFDTKPEAEAALEKFYKENPTYSELNESSPKQQKQYKLTPEKETVLNKYAQDEYGLDYKKLKDRKKTKEIYQKANNANFKYVTENIQSPFKPENQAKMVEAFDFKFNFDKYPRYGLPRNLPDGKINPEYSAVTDFKRLGFKRRVQEGLNEKQIAEIMDSHELPKGVKKWNFLTKDNPKGFKYGVNSKTNLSKRISNSLKEKAKYVVAADFSTPKGWMLNSMYRVWKNQTRDGGKSIYKPIYNKDKSKIFGFIDNTPEGGGNSFYGLKKNTPEGAVSWSKHKDYNRAVKFVDITERVGEKPNKIIQKLLSDKGITGEIKLNDILSYDRYYSKLSETAPSELIKKQIVKHHVSGVGAKNLARAAATKDIQLLTGAINHEVRKLENKVLKNEVLSVADNNKLKNMGAKIRGADGKLYGGGYLDPERQFGLIEKQAAEMVKKKSFTAGGMKNWNQVINRSKAQTMAKALEIAGVTGICKSGKVVKKAEGGRMGFAGVCGVAFAAEDPDGFMRMAKTSKAAEDAFKSGNIAKHLMKAKNWAKSNMGPTGWIGGELLVVGLGTAWDMSQGKGWKEAMDNWTGLGGHFGQAEARLKEIGLEQGYNEEEINEAMKIGQLMDLSTEAEGKQWELEQVQEQQDIGGTARYKTDPERRFVRPREYLRGEYQDPKRIRDLKTETPKLWEKGTELYESLKDYDFSVGVYDEMQQKKKKEEYDEMMKLRSKPMMPGYGQQFEVSGKPEYKAWDYYEGAEGGIASLKKYYD